MRRSVMMFVVMAIVITCSMVSASAVETCMPVEVMKVTLEKDGTQFIVVKNQDGDSFMFSDIKWGTKVGQRMYMCITLTFGKGNFWTMDERGDKEPFLSDKNPANSKKGR